MFLWYFAIFFLLYDILELKLYSEIRNFIHEIIYYVTYRLKAGSYGAIHQKILLYILKNILKNIVLKKYIFKKI